MYKKLECCKYCSFSFNDLTSSERANHSRWCDQNPKRPEYVAKNNATQMRTQQSIEKRTQGIKQAHKDGRYDERNRLAKGKSGTPHTAQTKEILRQKALASPHRRLVRSIRSYTQKDGTIVQLDSSWEEALAKRLDETNITWVRPGPIKYVDSNNITRNYFPDFYLPDYDVFLDPKNPYAFNAQIKKINCLTEQVKNLIILKTLDECMNYIPARRTSKYTHARVEKWYTLQI
jgi:hypothetical protein